MRAWILAGVLGLAGSAVLVIVGLSVPRRRSHRVTFVSLGLLGGVLSLGWLALGSYVDAVVE